MYVRPRVDVKSPDADASSNGQQPFGTSLGGYLVSAQDSEKTTLRVLVVSYPLQIRTFS
jgi:hypothetical protein